MAINRRLITPSEADTYLVPSSVYPQWMALDSEIKEFHIQESSNYIYTNWICEGVDLINDDLVDIDENIKLACARYAYANIEGLLYPQNDDSREIKSVTLKAGAVSKSTTYEESSLQTNSRNYLKPIDDIMLSVGCNPSNSSVSGQSAKTRSVPLMRV